MADGLVIVVSAPSGAGKTTICKKILDMSSKMVHSISVSTRKPRKGEINGVDYYFVQEKEFLEKRKKKKFVEWARVHGNYYGTPKDFLDESIHEGFDVILDIDVVGALNVKKKYPDSVLIFILPPSMKILENRLRERKTDDEKVIQQRLINAEKELGYVDKYDYVVINLELEEAIKSILSIIKAEKCRVNRFDYRY
ncbi:guanylate kinase [Candidatus Poribacteria bacterium]|nr:guanylate kinase [Candidatus Poribacteria bacterium]